MTGPFYTLWTLDGIQHWPDGRDTQWEDRFQAGQNIHLKPRGSSAVPTALPPLWTLPSSIPIKPCLEPV